jgi:RNA polymerase sigma factor (sigma-70 family)
MQQEDVFQAYKPLLFSIAYHMLGSVMDAEDCVQEAFVRWYQAKDLGETEAVRSPKSYLSTMVTRLSIDHLRSARVRREQYVGVWLPEPLISTDETSVTGMAELSVALSVAFLYLLEQLSPWSVPSSCCARSLTMIMKPSRRWCRRARTIVGKSCAGRASTWERVTLCITLPGSSRRPCCTSFSVRVRMAIWMAS